jgi:hypothetical protein
MNPGFSLVSQRRPHAGLAALITGLAAPVVLAACTAFGINPITPTKAMVVGRWIHKGGAVLVLRGDGTFSAMNMPYRFGEWSGSTPSTGSGTWYVGRLMSDAPRGIVLVFSLSYPVIMDELLVENCCGLPLTIFYDRGDPDEGITGQYQLTRQSA